MKRWFTSALGAAAALSLSLALSPPEPAAADVAAETISEWQLPFLWRAFTASPDPLGSPESDDPLYATCGEPDAALRAVASRNGARKVVGEAGFASDELSFALRAAGSPYIWPRTWTMRGKDLDPVKVEEALTQFMAKSTPLGKRRCGVARLATADGFQVVSVVVVDVIADVDSVPTLARVGDWLTLRGKLLVPATDAKVVLLGPRGKPKTVLASLTDDVVRSTFSVDQPGEWLVQVLANVATGPRPVLELRVHAGVAPPLRFAETLPAPGESAANEDATDSAALLAMINAARAARTSPRWSRTQTSIAWRESTASR
ncbi:MAG: CAP domain-containing protein [Polyangiaceae bacterium]